MLERIAIIVRELPIDGWMTIEVVIIRVLTGVTFPVSSRRLDAIVESLALNVAILIWRLIPWPILVRRRRGR
jgi:hypothetical protein